MAEGYPRVNPGWSTRARRRVALAVVLGLTAASWAASWSVGSAGAASQPSGGASGADVQWAQSILKEKGFDPGPIKGQMNPKTKTALGAYQKSIGLPASGELDPATVAHMMQGRPASSTMGTLGVPDPKRPRLSPNAQSPAPMASPAKPVEASGGEVGGVIGSVVRGGPGLPPPRMTAPTAPTTSSGAEPAPQAAPRASVTAGGPAPAMPGVVQQSEESGWSMTAPLWVRWLLMGIVGTVLALAGAIWWRSGQPSRGESLVDATSERRREPTLETTGASGGSGRLSAEPRLTAGRARRS